MATPHDQFMKELLARFPDQFLRLVAPKIVESLELEAIVFESEEHYPGGPTGRERRPDLVARVPIRLEAQEDDAAEEVLLHTEIELQYRSSTERRLLSYNRGLSLKYALTVHTFVLYLRGGPPGAQENVYEERSLGETLTSFRYYSFGLSRAPAMDYLARPEPLAWALAALMRPEKGQTRSQLGLACVRRIVSAEWLARSDCALLFECVMRYATLQPLEALEFDIILREVDDEEIREMTTTMVEWWRKQGLEKGRKQGLEKGRAEGQRDIVLRLLKERFGSLSLEVRRKVSAIESAEELTQLATRTLHVQSLEELGLA